MISSMSEKSSIFAAFFENAYEETIRISLFVGFVYFDVG